MKAKNNSGTPCGRIKNICIVLLTAFFVAAAWLYTKPLRDFFRAEFYMVTGRYREAQTLFEYIDETGKIPGAYDAKKRAMYQRAIAAAGKGNDELAMDLFYRLDDYRNSRLNFEKMAEVYVDELADISRYEYALDFLSAYSGDDQMKELEKELRLRIEKEQKSGK